MGRSPNWYMYVDPVERLEPNGMGVDLDDVFRSSLDPALVREEAEEETPAGISLFADPIVAASPSPFPEDRVLLVTDTQPIPVEWVANIGIMRACSTYGMHEDAYPEIGRTYRIAQACRYRFRKGHTYDVFYVTSTEPRTLCTWALRTDGVVLNVESFQPLCLITRMQWDS